MKWKRIETAPRVGPMQGDDIDLWVVDSTSDDDLSELIKLADHALMQAKSDGRDRIVIWDPPHRPESQSGESSGESSPESSGDVADETVATL